MNESISTEPIEANIPILKLGLDTVIGDSRIGSRNNKGENEDNYWPQREDVNLYDDIDYIIAGRLYIIADGVSRGLSGKEASQEAVKTIVETYYQQIFELNHYPTEADLEYGLRRAIIEADQKLLAMSKKQRADEGRSDEKSYLQTTVICGLLRGQRLIIASVGDSRLYRLRADISNPEQVEVTLPLEDTLGPNNYFVGIRLQPDQISIHSADLLPDDTLLLCSDGLYKYLAFDNDPEKARDEMRQIYAAYSKEEDGIDRVGSQLLEQADNPATGGGGDNITLIMMQPPHPSETQFLDEFLGHKQNREEALTKLVEIAWCEPDQEIRLQDGQQETILGLLGQHCAKKAKQLLDKEGPTIESAEWKHRATQLDIVSTLGLAELEEAQALYQKLGLDFDSNKKIVKEIFNCYEKAPTNPQLRDLTLTVTIDLANNALLLPDNSEATWEALRLLSPLLNKIASELETPDRESSNEILRQLEKQFIQQIRKIGVSRSKSDVVIKENSPNIFEWPYYKLVEELRPEVVPDSTSSHQRLSPEIRNLKIPDKPPVSLGARKSPWWPRIFELNSLLTKVKKHKWVTSLSILFLLVVCTLVFRVNVLNRAGELNSISLSEQSVTFQPATASPFPTIATSPAPTHTTTPLAIPVTPPSFTNTIASLSIESIMPKVEAIENARHQIDLTTRLKIELDPTFQDLEDSIIEVRTFVPPGLSPIMGGGQPPPEISTNPGAPIIQHVPLDQVDINNVIFESLYIVEWSDITHPSYTITVQSELKGPNRQILGQAEQTIPAFSIDYQPALTVTQSISPALTTLGDPITYTLTLYNPGQTKFNNFEVDRQHSQIQGLPDILFDQAQSQLKGLILEPGEEKKILVPTQVITNYPGPLTPSLTINGILADGTKIPANDLPGRLNIYANGITIQPQSCEDCLNYHSLSLNPGSASARTEQIEQLADNTAVKVLDAKQLEGQTWYYLEVVSNDGQPIRGWLLSERVQLDEPALKAYLLEKATSGD